MTATLKLSAGASVGTGQLSYSKSGALGGSYAAGATQITVVSASGQPAAGTPVRISQCDNGFSGWRGFDVPCTSGAAVDNGGLFICNTSACVIEPPTNITGQSQAEISLITAVSGNCTSGSPGCQLTISPPLLMPNWSSSNSAHAEFGGGLTTGAALEDATALITPNSGSWTSLGGYAGWLKGNRIIGAASGILGISALNGLVMNNYVSGASPGFFYSNDIEPVLPQNNYSTMVLNNIVVNGQGFWRNQYTGGEIYAYNFLRDGEGGLNTDPIRCHGGGICNMTLIEGNQLPLIDADGDHNTNNFDTSFRNNVSGWDGPFWNPNPNAFELDNFQRFHNFIGNAIGDGTRFPGGPRITSYQHNGGTNATGNVFSTGWQIPSETLSVVSMLRWGNCDTVTATCRFLASEIPNSTNMPSSTWPNAAAFQNATPANQNLPCSFFLTGTSTGPCTVKYSGGSGLPFWKVATAWSTFPTSPTSTTTTPFPPIGPEVTGGSYVNGHAYDIPAAIAYKYLPIDTTQQVAYTITASSWSNTGCSSMQGMTVPGPCETLTINMGSTAMDGTKIEHLIGGFQLAGLNANCIPAGLPPNGEILMAGSNLVGSTVTVVYSLPSSSPDNGSPNHCTGSAAFLYPDTRQFDERVYMNDGGAVQTLAPPPTTTAAAH